MSGVSRQARDCQLLRFSSKHDYSYASEVSGKASGNGRVVFCHVQAVQDGVPPQHVLEDRWETVEEDLVEVE